MSQIEIVRRIGFPRQIDDCLHILHLHRIIGRLRMQALQLPHLFLKSLCHGSRPFLDKSLIFQVLDFPVIGISTQLFLDGLDLLLQEIFLLLLVQILLGFHLDGSLQLQQLELTIQMHHQFVCPLLQIGDFQKLLPVIHSANQIRTTEINQIHRIAIILQRENDLFLRLDGSHQHFNHHVLDSRYQSIELFVFGIFIVFQDSNLSTEIRRLFNYFVQFNPLLPLQDDSGRAIRHI